MGIPRSREDFSFKVAYISILVETKQSYARKGSKIPIRNMGLR